jgi:hypothetical protein
MIRGWSIQDGRTDADQAWITVSNSWRTRGDDQRILSLPIDASIQAMSVFPQHQTSIRAVLMPAKCKQRHSWIGQTSNYFGGTGPDSKR